MRLRSSLLVLIAAAAVGCGHRQHHARHAANDAAPAQPAPQDAPPPQPAAAEPAQQPEPEAVPAPVPEASASPPQEVSAVNEPPEPVYEEQTAQPTVETVWVPGYWHPEGARWTWYVGEWRSPPHGHVYAEPYYERVGTRIVYVRGYWRPAATVASRSYGGTRIIFVKPARPADYSARYHHPIRAVEGLPPGARLETRYQPVVITHTAHNSQIHTAPGSAAAPTTPARTANLPPGSTGPARARNEIVPSPVSAPPPPARTASAPPPPAPRVAAPPAPTQPAQPPQHIAAPPASPPPPPPRVVVAAPPPAPAPRPVATPAPVKAAPPPPPSPTATQKKKRP